VRLRWVGFGVAGIAACAITVPDYTLSDTGAGGAVIAGAGVASSSSGAGTAGMSASSTSSSSASGTSASSASGTSTSASSTGVGGSVVVDAGDGFGPCVTQAQVNAQSTLPEQVDFCDNNLFACLFCSCPGVHPGDIVCSPTCLCAPMPPICPDDAGTD
jgi:hypothetical protein